MDARFLITMAGPLASQPFLAWRTPFFWLCNVAP
jgi:hypothetical protein